MGRGAPDTPCPSDTPWTVGAPLLSLQGHMCDVAKREPVRRHVSKPPTQPPVHAFRGEKTNVKSSGALERTNPVIRNRMV